MSSLTNLFSRIADAIRAKKGTEGHINASDFPDEIMSIPTGTAPTGTKSVTITQNGTRTEDVSGYANVQINTNVPQGYTPTGHRDYLITTPTGRIDDNVSGIADISIIVNVPTSSSSGYYATKTGSSYPIVFYNQYGAAENLYFATMDQSPSNFNHIVVVQKTQFGSGKVLARLTNTATSKLWDVYDANGNEYARIKLNGNNIPIKLVSVDVEIYATT